MVLDYPIKKYTDTIEAAKKVGKLSKLCERGFFVVNSDKKIMPSEFENWNRTSVLGFEFYVHPGQKFFYKITESMAYFIIGHAYNPYTDAISEEVVLRELIQADRGGKGMFIDYVNSLTGIFLLGKIERNAISILLDCAGMLSVFYGEIQGKKIITSHTALPAMIYGLKRTEYVEELLRYRFYKLYGSFLPGDITPYAELKRLVPNTIVQIGAESGARIERFFPLSPNEEITNETEYEAQLHQIAGILKKTLSLVAQKWRRPSISLTGGMDSKTTLAAAKDDYEAFSFFSYITSTAEKIDADAAHRICDHIGLPHWIYQISENPEDYAEYDAVKKILQFNKDFIGTPNTNDVCKRIYFDNNDYFDVEIKSWVSEIARANYYKKFGKKKMPKRITARRCSSMYKIFLHNRNLLKQTDRIFDDYISKTKLRENLYNYDWSDLFLWEIRYGGWGGLVITGEHKYSFDITIPYNNRKLLQMMLAVPLEKRRSDQMHRDLIQIMNAEVDALGITITNLNETKFREFCERCYFDINTNLPF